jgi:hypothetical protein
MRIKHDPDYYRQKLREWNPSWNVEAMSNKQVIAIYEKERRKIVQHIMKNDPSLLMGGKPNETT